MLTYLLIAGWLGRRLDLDGRGRSIAGVMLLVLSLLPVPPATRDAWPLVRTALNAVASGPAVVWGLLHGGRPTRRRGLLMVTGMRSGTGPRQEVMVGSVLLTRHGQRRIGDPLVRHELRHADQWAILGPLLMPPAYWLAEAAGDVLTDCGNGGNVFEIGAGLRAGGYVHTAEVRCAGPLSSQHRKGGVPSPRWALDWALPPALPVSRRSGPPPPRQRRYCYQGRSSPECPAPGSRVRAPPAPRRSAARPTGSMRP